MQYSSAPRISVIIPCYNHGNYLAKAVQSVFDQHYQDVEIIVVDDGSADNTREIAEQFPGVKYIFQENQGLSAARNTGIEASTGNYLVFLDADDWLLKKALSINAAILNHDKSLGFVSGAFLLSRPGLEQEVRKQVNSDHYLRLLQENYISMHATVMYTRRVFRTIRFDTSLRACEDYDVYLRVSREYPVYHHTQLLAAYWQHDANMSSDLALMMKSALEVLKRQEESLRSSLEKRAFIAGIQYWKEYYAINMYARLVDVKHRISKQLRQKFLNSLWNNNRKYYFKYIFFFPLMPLRKLANRKS